MQVWKINYICHKPKDNKIQSWSQRKRLMRNYWQVIHLLTWKHVHLILSRVLKHNIVNKPNILVINQNNMKKNKPCWIKNIILGYFAIQKMFINKALNMFFLQNNLLWWHLKCLNFLYLLIFCEHASSSNNTFHFRFQGL